MIPLILMIFFLFKFTIYNTNYNTFYHICKKRIRCKQFTKVKLLASIFFSLELLTLSKNNLKYLSLVSKVFLQILFFRINASRKKTSAIETFMSF